MQSLLLLNLLDQQVIIILARLTWHQSNGRIVILLTIIITVISIHILSVHLHINLDRIYIHLHTTNKHIRSMLVIILIITVLAVHLRVHIYTPHINHLPHILRYTTLPPTLLPHFSTPNLPLFNSTQPACHHHPLHLRCRTLFPHSSHTSTLHLHHLPDILNTISIHSSNSSLVVIMG